MFYGRLQAGTVLAETGYEADERILLKLEQAGRTAATPSKINRTHPRGNDRDIYKVQSSLLPVPVAVPLIGKAAFVDGKSRAAHCGFGLHLRENPLSFENFAKRKQFRAIATRFDRTARSFLAAVYFVSAVIRLD